MIGVAHHHHDLVLGSFPTGNVPPNGHRLQSIIPTTFPFHPSASQTMVECLGFVLGTIAMM